MSLRPTTVERAYQLASSGECAGVGDVRNRLQTEGYSNITGHLYGSTITAALRDRCKSAFVEPQPESCSPSLPSSSTPR